MKKTGVIIPTARKPFLENNFFSLFHSIYWPLHNVNLFLDATIEMLHGNGSPCSQRETVDFLQSMWSAKNKIYLLCKRSSYSLFLFLGYGSVLSSKTFCNDDNALYLCCPTQ